MPRQQQTSEDRDLEPLLETRSKPSTLFTVCPFILGALALLRQHGVFNDGH